MKNTNERMRLMVLLLCLLILISTVFSMAVMAQAEPITPEDYDGMVILCAFVACPCARNHDEQGR